MPIWRRAINGGNNNRPREPHENASERSVRCVLNADRFRSVPDAQSSGDIHDA